MTYLAGLLIAVVLIQHILHGRQMDSIIAQASHERAQLLDRIQHPEVRQVQAGEQVEYEPPKDTAEMAHIGQIVPDFIQVGENNASTN